MDQEITRALESLIREDSKRPSEDRLQDLIEAGVIDEQGRVVIGSRDKSKQDQKSVPPNGPSDASSAREMAKR